MYFIYLHNIAIKINESELEQNNMDKSKEQDVEQCMQHNSIYKNLKKQIRHFSEILSCAANV